MAKKTKKKGPTPPRTVRLEARGKPGQILPTVDRAKKKRRANLITAVIVFVIVGGAVTAAVLAATGGKKDLPGLSTTTAPWPADTTNLGTRVARLHLPAFADNATSFHHHVHLDVIVAGTASAVPADLGHLSTGGIVSIHAHDTSGVIHLEAVSTAVFTLGDVFDVWGVRLTADCVGGYCNSAGEKFAVYANGTKVTGNPADYKLKQHDEIAVIVGEPPTPIPSKYTFQKGQ